MNACCPAEDRTVLSSKRTYLDYNASAPLLVEAREAMVRALDLQGNPSSVHAEGRRLRGIIEDARDRVAALAGARPADVVFTSGATEANVTVLSRPWTAILAPGIEHDSILAPARSRGARWIELPVTASGVVDAGALAAIVLKGDIPAAGCVVALQLANNETGVIQPVADVAEFTRAHGIACHTDAVQAAGRIAIDFNALGVDTLAVSAHKIGGPKGAGALVIREGSAFAALMTGGGQERRRRAGTENPAAIAGFGAAAEAALAGLANFERISALRDRLERGVLQATPQAVVFGHDEHRLANTSCIGLAGAPSEIAVIKLDVAGFAVSAGSACSSGKVGASHVLAAMGAAPEAARGAIRVSLGPQTTQDEIDAFLAAWRGIHTARAPGQARATAAVRAGQLETLSRTAFAAAGLGE
jgi:cysteine desulfurase